ncbi:MAG: hypothetical protein AAF821_27055 [Cyanobacteria bacterium P01_D01_bin.156]
MPSSSRPYQSKLLRFVLRQWQQGWQRQDIAFRQIQSTATLGAQVAILPIYAIIRAVKRANLTLNSGSSQSFQHDINITKSTENITDIAHSLTAILTYTQQKLSKQQTTQLSIRSTRKATRKKLRFLPSLVEKIQQQFPFRKQTCEHDGKSTLTQWHSGNITTTQKRSEKIERLVKHHSSLERQASSNLLQQGTTLASSLETRQLVLINLKNEVFDIFTPEQQADLQHYIDRIMYAYRQTHTIAHRQTKRLSNNTLLAIGAVFVTALPAEFRKAWNQILSNASDVTLPDISNDASKPRFRVFYPQSTSFNTVRAKARKLQTTSTASNTHRRLSSRAPHAFEANVNNVRYLEHPLERILRWLDRVLTWCEHRWQRLMDQSFAARR